MKILVVGAGSIGTRHATNASKKTEVAVLDADVEKVSEVSKRIDVIGFSNENEAWEWSPDGVVIAVPTHLHIECALRAVKNGVRKILIEKPVSHSMDGIQNLIMSAKTQNSSLFVVANMRFHPAIQAVRDNIASVGKPLFAKAHYGNYLPDMRPGLDYRNLYAANRKQGGGVILDVIHEIDYMTWFFGKVGLVIADAATLSDLEIDTEDFATVIMKHSSNVRTTLTLDYLQHCKRRGCEIVGTEGLLVWQSEGRSPERCEVRAFEKKTGRWKTLLKQDAINKNLPYKILIDEFIKAVEGLPHRLASVDEGFSALGVALAARKSSDNRRAELLVN